MRLVPPVILNCKSNAERKVFGFLKEIAFSQYDVALHSLNIGKHEYKRWSEADFLVVSKRGILLLEVKGGRVACNNGSWEFTDRFGNMNAKNESPAAQACSAFNSIEKKYLYPRFAKLKKVPMGWGVVFPDIPRLVNKGQSDLPEHPDEITAYDVDCKGPNSFREYLERAFDHWENKSRREQIAPSLALEIAQKLRPNFERIPSLNTQLSEGERDMCQFTEEQYARMDELSENEQIMLSGGAGTGKTFIAAACARYEAAENRTVLLVTRSSYLASFLQSRGLPPDVTVASLEEIEAGKASGPYDTLIVDEGQDLCDFRTLDLLGERLKGGWEKGRWRWFGDPHHQVSPSFPVDDDSYQFLRDGSFKCNLRHNVRNTGRVISAIASLSGVDVGEPKGAPDGGGATLLNASSPAEAQEALISTLRKWLADYNEVKRSEIAVLVDETRDPAEFADWITAQGVRAESLGIRALGATPRDSVLVARIEDFKGLERPLVCVVGLGATETSHATNAYKAISRANHAFVLIAGPREIEALISKNIESKIGNH